jgi:hypothetical protein
MERPRASAHGVLYVIQAGAELVLFKPFFDEGARHMEQLATEVLPNL